MSQRGRAAGPAPRAAAKSKAPATIVGRLHPWPWLVVSSLLLLFALALLQQWPAALLNSSVTPVATNESAAAAVPGRNTPIPPKTIGIIAGHNRLKTLSTGEVVRDTSGEVDYGALCEDGTAEADITLNIARRVAAELREKDKQPVELLGEFDPRLRGYFGVALVSLHVDACLRGFTGYKVARVITSAVPEAEDRLVNCLRQQYAAATGLAEHRDTITPDMQEYHAFREIALTTPGAILEMGFLREDQALLKQGDKPVKGVVEGIRCFFRNQRKGDRGQGTAEAP